MGRLCVGLGYTPEEVKAMDSADLSWLMAVDSKIPIPDWWLMCGLICSVIANCHRDSKTKPFKPEDFMPKIRRPKKPQTVAQMKFVLDALALQSGSKLPPA